MSRTSALLDRVVAGLFALPAGAILLNEAEGAWSIVLAALAFVLAVSGMAQRRRWPSVALAAQLAAVAVLELAEPRAVAVALCALGYTLYAAASMLRLRNAVVALVAALVAAGSTAGSDLGRPGGAVLFAFVYSAAWVVGVGLGLNRRYTATLLAQQAELAAAELRRAQDVVLEERLRIARDLHDVVAHGISVITVQAGYGGLVVEQHPDRAREALAAIETVSRQTLTEMRQLLRVLRRSEDGHGGNGHGGNGHGGDAAPDLAPAPMLSDLDQLVAGAAGSGLDVRLTVIGARRPLAPGVEAAAYRTVQEAVTNVLRHAGARRVEVTLRYAGSRVDVEVSDDGRGPGAAIAGGYGLVGMRERALMYGGSFRAGGAPGGGFQVISTFPAEPSDDQSDMADLLAAEPIS